MNIITFRYDSITLWNEKMERLLRERDEGAERMFHGWLFKIATVIPNRGRLIRDFSIEVHFTCRRPNEE